ncbi:MAG: hypothetical protein AB1422_04895 [bacterium]
MQKGFLLAVLSLGLMMILAPKTADAQVGTSGTTAGSEIINGTDTGTIGIADQAGDIVVTYMVGSVGRTSTTASVLTRVVEQIYGGEWGTLPENGTDTPGAAVDYLYTLENKGNAADTFYLSLNTTGLLVGWTAEILKDGVATTTITLAEDAEGTFTVRVTISGTAANLETGAVIVTGTTTDDGGTYTVGNWIYGGADTLTHRGTTTALAAVVTLTKSMEYATPTGYLGNNRYVPGGTITYIITCYNAGSYTAGSVTITDKLPLHTSYATGTLRMGTAGDTYNTAGTKTDGYDNQGTWDADWNDSNQIVRFEIDTIEPAETVKLYFRVYIK